jgi:hypothetical protein
MMKKEKLVLLLLWVLPWGLWGQAPGFLGNRNVGKVSMNLAPAVAYGVSEGLWGPNFRLGLQYERVINRRFSAGLGVAALTNRVRYDDRDAPVGEGVGLARVSALTGSVSLRAYQFWSTGTVAPLGPYQELEVFFIRYGLHDLDGRYPPGGQVELGSFSDMGLCFSMGTQRVWLQAYTIDLAGQIGTVMGALRTSFRRDASPRDLGTARLARHFSLSFRLAVGGLFSTKREKEPKAF